jgi:hypothetical protein
MMNTWALEPFQEWQTVEQVNAPVQEDRQIIVIDMADKMDISCGSAYSIIHKNLGHLTIYARRVPKQLTDEHKEACVEICLQFLQ